MSGSFRKHAWVARLLFACMAFAAAGMVAAAQVNAKTPETKTDGAHSLRARYALLNEQLRDNQFGRPLYLDSLESSDDLKGDIYALVDYPFAAVNAALNDPAHWCEVMILHINTKHCRASTANGRTALAVSI